MYVFLRTYNSSRGGLCVGMLTVDKNGFLEELNIDKGKYSWGTWRYVKLGGVTHHMKDMLLPEFEEVFEEGELTEEQIDEMFRKEVAEKYGKKYKELKKQKKKPAIKKKDLILGGIYLDDNGTKWVNFGEIKLTDEYYHMKGYNYWSQKKDRKDGRVNIKKGYLYSRVWYKDRELKKILNYSCGDYLLKTRKRFVEFTGEVIEMQVECVLTNLREIDRTIKFLDYKEEII